MQILYFSHLTFTSNAVVTGINAVRSCSVSFCHVCVDCVQCLWMLLLIFSFHTPTINSWMKHTQLFGEMALFPKINQVRKLWILHT